MSLLAEFITGLYQNIGISNDDNALKDLVTKIANVEMSDDLVNKFNQGYFTEASAKANPKIQGHFRAQFLNGVDDELKPLYDEMGLPDEVKTELLGIGSSTKRAAALVRKVKELTEQKANASKGDKAELNKQIEELNNQIKAINQKKQEEIEALKNEYSSKVEDLYLSQFLSAQKYASDGFKDEDYLLPKAKIQKALQEKGLKKILEGKEFKLQTEQGTDYFENNTKVDFKTFAEKVLADNKLTAVSEPPAQSNQTQFRSDVGNNKLSGLAAYDAAIAEVSAK